MKGAIQTSGYFWVFAIVGQLAGKLIGPCLIALTLTNLTELRNARSHRTHIVQRVSNHIGHVGNGSLASSRIETLQRYVTINDGTLHQVHISLVDHIIQLRNGIEYLRRGTAQRLQVGQSCPVHHLLGLSLTLSKCRIVGKELDSGSSRLSLFTLLGRNINTTATHYNGFMEQATSQRTLTECTHAAGSGTLSEDGYVVGVATKLSDILLDPLQRLYLVQNAIVATNVMRALCRQFRMGHKTKDAQAVVDGDEDDIL